MRDPSTSPPPVTHSAPVGMTGNNLWQSSSWERFQSALHHRTERVNANLMLIHPLFFGFYYGYIPRGPLQGSVADIEALLNAVEPILQKYRLVFLRMDPEQSVTVPSGVRAALSQSIQPETTLIIDLAQDEQSIRSQMKRKGRYNIDVARRKGVRVMKAVGAQERKKYCDLFYDLLISTGQRDGFSIHDAEYYQTMLTSIPEAEIFVAFLDHEPLAAGIFIFQSDRAYYYYGASSREKKELMAPYLLQWEAIREAKFRGCRSYDFLGISPSDAAPSHPWHGISEFKLKFGGRMVESPRPVDIIYHPFLYKIYRMLKWIQK